MTFVGWPGGRQRRGYKKSGETGSEVVSCTEWGQAAQSSRPRTQVRQDSRIGSVRCDPAFLPANLPPPPFLPPLLTPHYKEG